jgi:hypothetical protein
MKIVYYFNKEKNISPVKDFLFKYDIKKDDSEKTVNHKIKVLAFIDQAIKFITENNGKPIPPIAKTIKGCKFHELRVRDGGNLIRIFYFVYIREKIVLLNALEKPENYEKGQKKKIDKRIKEAIEITGKYYKNYLTNQTYEEYK